MLVWHFVFFQYCQNLKQTWWFPRRGPDTLELKRNRKIKHHLFSGFFLKISIVASLLFWSFPFTVLIVKKNVRNIKKETHCNIGWPFFVCLFLFSFFGTDLSTRFTMWLLWGDGSEAQKEKNKKSCWHPTQKTERPKLDGPNASGLYRWLCGPISPLLQFNSVQLSEQSFHVLHFLDTIAPSFGLFWIAQIQNRTRIWIWVQLL